MMWHIALLALLAVLAASCASSPERRAPRTVLTEPVADDVSPRLSTCLGRTTHCVMPDFNLSTVNYDFSSKKWAEGVVGVGAGFMLLFWSTSPLASGVAMHGAGQFGQGQPSYFALTPTLVLARYFEAGATIKLADGNNTSVQLTLGLGIAWDLLTGRTMGERLTDAKVAQFFRLNEVAREGR